MYCTYCKSEETTINYSTVETLKVEPGCAQTLLGFFLQMYKTFLKICKDVKRIGQASPSTVPTSLLGRKLPLGNNGGRQSAKGPPKKI
jgi:hypothetical protein